MSLPAHYDAMRAAALPRLAQGNAELDSLLDATHDTRRGITLLARPPAFITTKIMAILADFQDIEPEQYYYPATDIHLTILSIISCYPGFTLAAIDPSRYIDLVAAILRQTSPFTVDFRGLTASAGSIMVQGFLRHEGLAELRARLREAFRQSGLPQSIDQRYSIQTAHSTILRFRQPLRHPARLLQLLAQYQHTPIGTFDVAATELVFNDWYQRAATTVVLQRFELPAR